MRFFKLALKIGLYLLVISLLIAVGYIAYHYKSDIPVKKLQEKYAFKDSRYVDIDGMQVHYRQVGRGHPLVLLHGFGGHIWNWEKWTALLKENFQVISLDLPGFGFTGPHPQRKYETDTYVAFLHAFFDEIGIDTFHLAGHSMGGEMAWEYALAYPNDVKKLVLVNASGYPRKKETKNIQGFQLLQLPVINQLAAKITPRPILKQTIKATYGYQLPKENVELYMDMMRRTGNRQALIDKMRTFRIDRASHIQNVKTPTLIIWGDQDVLVSHQNAYKFEKDIKDSKVIIYENVGHMPMEQIPERSAGDVKDFLK